MKKLKQLKPRNNLPNGFDSKAKQLKLHMQDLGKMQHMKMLVWFGHLTRTKMVGKFSL